jgi:hypothetical protein
MKVKRVLLIILITILLLSPVQASLFDEIVQKILPQKAITPSSPLISIYTETHDSFMEKLYKLNTPRAIENLNKEMDYYSLTALKVRMYEIPWQKSKYIGENFYVVKDIGVIENYYTNDRELILTYSQIMKMYPYFEDGEITFIERLQIYGIINKVI